MKFFQTIQDSIYSPKFYSEIPNKPFKQGIGYFLLLILLLTILKLITLISPLLIEAPALLQKSVSDLVDCYPNDLEVKITNGQVNANVSEPYFLPPCGRLSQEQNLLVIDTKTPFSSTKFDEYETEVWITKDSVVYKKHTYETTSYSLTQIKDFKFNKALLNSFANMLSPWYKFIGPILLLVSFIGIYIAYIFRLIYLLILSAVIFLISKFTKPVLSYGQTYKVGLYAITLGLIVELVVSLTSRWTNFDGFQFMTSVITTGVVLANLFLPNKNR